MINSVILISAVMDTVSKSESFLLALLGFVIVFIVLAILVGLLLAFQNIYKVKWLREDYVSPKKQAALALIEEQQNQSDTSEDEEVVAAITAAITCILKEEKNQIAVAPFKIKNIKRIK